MALNKWSIFPPSWWPSGWWPYARSEGSGDAIHLFNGLHLVHRYPPQGDDVRAMIGSKLVGIPVIPATDDTEGAVRISNGTVYALKHT